ncbi:MAG: hypothetical protein Q9163_003909, partial [Psora crenata]
LARSNGEARPKIISSSSTAPRPSFLALPLELRHEIYANLLYDSCSTLLDLLCVNRRLARELKPFLYKRPLSFDGQCQLFDWLAEVDPECLRHVSDVRMKLVDINPATIVGALGKRLRGANLMRAGLGPDRADDNPYDQACCLELKKLEKAFSLLYGVKHLTIIACTPSDPQPPPRMVARFSHLLGRCFPHLQSLISEQPLFPVDFLRNKPRLRRLQFPANTESSADDISSVFRNLSDLELDICRPPPPSGAAYEWGCMPEILPSVPPLRGLGLHERLESYPPGLAEEVFVHGIEAIKRHLRSLRTLTLAADPPAAPHDASIMRRNLLRFVEASSLRHVEVLGIYASVYRHLPGTTETFTLRLDHPSTPSTSIAKAMTDMMSHVKFRAVTAAKHPHIPHLSRLREIQVQVAEHPTPLQLDHGPDRDELVDTVRSRLRKIGILFTWVVNATPPTDGSCPSVFSPF